MHILVTDLDLARHAEEGGGTCWHGARGEDNIPVWVSKIDSTPKCSLVQIISFRNLGGNEIRHLLQESKAGC